jgi:lipopolysaccharide export system protein LptA
MFAGANGPLLAQVIGNHNSTAPVNFTADRIEAQHRADRVVVSGRVAIYDLNSKLITMLGNVALTQGSSRLNGGRLVMDLNTGRSTVDGRASGGGVGVTGSAGGRVTGTFSVPQRKN